MALQKADAQGEEENWYTSAVYTHLCPFRAHTLHLSLQAPLIRLLSQSAPYDSGWHGYHNYVPNCDIFILINFSYMGRMGKVKHKVCFQKLQNVSHEGMERYLGFELTAQDCIVETAEVVVRTPQDPNNQSSTSSSKEPVEEVN